MGVPAPSHLHHRSQRVAVSRLSHVAWGGSVCEAYQEHRQTQRKAAPPCPELAPCYPTPGSSHAAHTALTVATARNVRAHRVGISRLQRSTHNHAVVADPHVAPYAGCLNDTVTPDHSVVADGLLLYESEAPPEDSTACHAQGRHITPHCKGLLGSSCVWRPHDSAVAYVTMLLDFDDRQVAPQHDRRLNYSLSAACRQDQRQPHPRSAMACSLSNLSCDAQLRCATQRCLTANLGACTSHR